MILPSSLSLVKILQRNKSTYQIDIKYKKMCMDRSPGSGTAPNERYFWITNSHRFDYLHIRIDLIYDESTEILLVKRSQR